MKIIWSDALQKSFPLATNVTTYHLSGTWLQQPRHEYSHKSSCWLSLTSLKDMWFCLLLQPPPQPWKSICACIFFFFLLTHSHIQFVQPWQTSTDLRLFPFSWCPTSPPLCHLGALVAPRQRCAERSLSAEGVSHIFIKRWKDLKQTHRLICVLCQRS